MPKGFDRYKIGAFAILFIENPDTPIKNLCQRLDVPEALPYRWQKSGELDKAFDNLQFNGSRKLRRRTTRDAHRDSAEAIASAKAAYQAARQNGEKKGEADRIAAAAGKVSRKTIYNWRKQFEWDEENL